MSETHTNPETFCLSFDFPSLAAASRENSKLRRLGLRSPADTWLPGLVIGATVVGLVIMNTLWGRPSGLLLVMIAYFAGRMHADFFVPALARAFAPVELRRATSGPLRVQLDKGGLRLKFDKLQMTYDWDGLPPPQVYAQGLVIRTRPFQAIPVPARTLPEGMTPDDLAAVIESWKGRN